MKSSSNSFQVTICQGVKNINGKFIFIYIKATSQSNFMLYNFKMHPIQRGPNWTEQNH